jgi:hypothetical protein
MEHDMILPALKFDRRTRKFMTNVIWLAISNEIYLQMEPFINFQFPTYKETLDTVILQHIGEGEKKSVKGCIKVDCFSFFKLTLRRNIW